MPRVFVLGGRTFSVPEQTTARQDGYMLAQAIEAGIMKFVSRTLTDDTVLELTATVLKSGKREHLLAGGLVEDGVKWTPQGADANAEFFGDLTDPESKAQMATGFVDVLAGFFPTALASSTPSPSASSAEAPALDPPSNGDATSTQGAEPALAASGAG